MRRKARKSEKFGKKDGKNSNYAWKIIKIPFQLKMTEKSIKSDYGIMEPLIRVQHSLGGFEKS